MAKRDRRFARLIRRLRESQGISQAALAERAGTSQSYVSEVERGNISIRLDQAVKLVRCLGFELSLEARPMPMRSDPARLAELDAWTAEERITHAAETFNFQRRLREGAQTNRE